MLPPSAYSKGKIYRIKSIEGDAEYIGSTTRELKLRYDNHKSAFGLFLKGSSTKYCYSYEVLKYDDHVVELIEEYPCDTKKLLREREGYYIRISKTEGINVGQHIAGRSIREWIDDNYGLQSEKWRQYREKHKDEISVKNKSYREKNKTEINKKRKIYRETHKDDIREKDRKYREKNREKILQQHKDYYTKNKVKILEQQSVFRKDHAEEIKEYQANYREQNKDTLSEKKKEYRELHKDEINAKKRTKIQCECGSMSNSSHMARHKRTAKHQKWEAEN